jgi:hypothetical protein
MLKIIAELFIDVLVQVVASIVLQLMDKITPTPWF